ncbi:hypothetical protein [Herbaspirillum sp.]|uniref:hypothetical protein n=1 Tax=Herbaspirillum sp. TaxID=1890675 RepID=UPI001B1058A1|nr:hypothetical protein [Herbaspirillum sp.]MBO9538322.1 hypothetical protein [Herbaspirillum sp.]
MAANSGSPGKSGAGIRRYTEFCLKGNAKRKNGKNGKPGRKYGQFPVGLALPAFAYTKLLY